MKQIPAKMKAFVVTEPKKWSVKEVDVPKPKYKEVLIEMETSGICHTDLHAGKLWLISRNLNIHLFQVMKELER